jgi:hypothetical protein
MWLKTPESIGNVIWEAPMEPISFDAIESLVLENKNRGKILGNWVYLAPKLYLF